jgi:hypothetical protein
MLIRIIPQESALMLIRIIPQESALMLIRIIPQESALECAHHSLYSSGWKR